jgi:hypothetical protein
MKCPKQWFKTPEAAEYLNVHVKSFNSVMKRNGCVAAKTSKNGDYRWHRAQLDSFRIFNTSKPTLTQRLKLRILNWVF